MEKLSDKLEDGLFLNDEEPGTSSGTMDTASESGAGDQEQPDEPASWAAEVEEDEELKKLESELPKDTDTAVEMREKISRLLLALQISSTLFMTSGKATLTEEYLAEAKIELEESLDDLMEMIEYNDGNLPDSKKIIAAQKQIQLRKIDKLKVVSWDLCMLSYKFMGSRAKAIVDLILKEKFDIVCLQEANPFVWKYLICRLFDQYEFCRGRKPDGRFMDFTVTLVRLDTLILTNSKIVYYNNTRERRTLLKTEVMLGNTKICILNTHLESMLGNSKFRMMQLQKCYDICGSLPSDFNVFFCGSLNVREWEIAKMKRPKNLIDMWEAFGDKTNQITWDLKINKLIQMPAPADDDKRPYLQPQKRFGRIYFRKAQQALLQPISFSLTGKELVVDNKYYASDHWALFCPFKVSKDCYVFKKEEESSDSKFNRNADLLEGEDGKKTEVVQVQEEVKDNWDDSD